jgi:hypothetical protein
MLCFTEVGKFLMITEINISAVVTIYHQVVECFGFNLRLTKRVNLHICLLNGFFYQGVRQSDASRRCFVDQLREFPDGNVQYRFAAFGIRARFRAVSGSYQYILQFGEFVLQLLQVSLFLGNIEDNGVFKLLHGFFRFFDKGIYSLLVGSFPVVQTADEIINFGYGRFKNLFTFFRVSTRFCAVSGVF